MIRTGIFGGSYNPIHIGHLALANYLCEYGELDELWFMVSPQNPFKANSSDLWNDDLRLKLVQLAVEDYSKFQASDFEFHLPRPSNMVTTLQKLRETYPDREFILIIGADNWLSFPRWKDANIIMKLHRLMVYPRPGFEIDESTLPPRVQLVNTPMLEVSSTFIRESLKQGKDVRYFLHPKVWQKISELPSKQEEGNLHD